jgi:hypothetical protein
VPANNAGMATAKTLPDQIEIFRAGRHVDDAGNAHEFSAADVAAIAAAYDPALREAPLTVGHPAGNLPAYGWVKGMTAEGGLLKMNPHQVEPQFAEMVQAGRFKKRSASFYPPTSPSNPTPGRWYLRHVAFLGAQPPAVAGLKDIQFSEGDAAGAVSFSEAVPTPSNQETTTMDKETEARLAQAEADAKAAKEAQAAAEAATKAAQDQLAQFAEQQRQATHASHVSFAETQVKAGKLLPKDQATTVAVLDQLAAAQPVEFSEGGATKKVAPAEWFKGLIEGAKPVVDFGEFAGGGAGTESTKGLSDAEIDQRAKAYASKHNVSYSEALNHVVSFTA